MIYEEDIRKLCLKGAVRMTLHVERQCRVRSISMEQIEQALMHGKIIKQYSDDRPYPSCLILYAASQPLHVVASVNKTEVYVITAYHPDPNVWEPDFLTKKGAKQK